MGVTVPTSTRERKLLRPLIVRTRIVRTRFFANSAVRSQEFFGDPESTGRRPAARRRPMQPDRPPLLTGAGHGSHPSTTGHPDRQGTGTHPKRCAESPGHVTFCPNPTEERDTAPLRDPPSGADPPTPHRPPATARLTSRHRRIGQCAFRGRPDASGMPYVRPVPSSGPLPALSERSGPHARPKSKERRYIDV